MANELLPQAAVTEFGFEAQEPPLGQIVPVDFGHSDAALGHWALAEPAKFWTLKSPTIGDFVYFVVHCSCKINANDV